MIIWLASYPRSGNTLLRTLLYQHFGIPSFSDEALSESVGLTATSKAAIGHKETPCDWDEFYEQAHQSNDVVLIKTHRPPTYDNKAIYVVRDGRSTYLSYARYHASFIKDKPQSLLGLILGLDFYGGWSDHYRLWTQIKNPILVIRYEDLIDPTQTTMEKIATFLGRACPEREWKNPFDELKKENPEFFREGRAQWHKSGDWSDLIDAIFFLLHGDLMRELGYANTVEVDQATGQLTPEIRELLNVTKQFVRDLRNYREICRERQTVIDDLKRTCDERLTLISRLDQELKTIAGRSVHN
jgi:hypothetical protein